MSVDAKERNALRSALVLYMSGRMRSYDFDDQVAEFRNKNTIDQSVREIAEALYLIYDDLIDHPISVTPQGWEALRRTVAFLHTDLEITATRRDDFWPFADEAQWRQNERHLSNKSLPPYDPAIHGRPANPWWNRIPTSMGLAIIVAVVALFLVVASVFH